MPLPKAPHKESVYNEQMQKGPPQRSSKILTEKQEKKNQNTLVICKITTWQKNKNKVYTRSAP